MWHCELQSCSAVLKEVIPGTLDRRVKSCWVASWFGLFDQQYCTIVVISGFIYSAFKHASFVTSVQHEPTFLSCLILNFFNEFIIVKIFYYLNYAHTGQSAAEEAPALAHFPASGVVTPDWGTGEGRPSSPSAFPRVHLFHILWQQYFHLRWAKTSNGREGKERVGTIAKWCLPPLCLFTELCCCNISWTFL